MWGGWHHENEMNRDIDTKNSVPDFKEKQRPASANLRLLMGFMSDFGTALRKPLPRPGETGWLYSRYVEKLSKSGVLKGANKRC